VPYFVPPEEVLKPWVKALAMPLPVLEKQFLMLLERRNATS